MDDKLSSGIFVNRPFSGPSDWLIFNPIAGLFSREVSADVSPVARRRALVAAVAREATRILIHRSVVLLISPQFYAHQFPFTATKTSPFARIYSLARSYTFI